MMKRITFLFASVVLSLFGKAQTISDKTDIYNAIIKTYVNQDIPVINETIAKIYKYDIDGNFQKWFYQPGTYTNADTSVLVGRVICVVPVQYAQALTSYFVSRNMSVDTANLLRQADVIILDSLDKYVPADKTISRKKAPLFNSGVRNLFKKQRAIGLSNILFDTQSKTAIVKMHDFVRNGKRTENPSKLIVLTKGSTEWKITGSLDEKM